MFTEREGEHGRGREGMRVKGGEWTKRKEKRK